MSGKVIEDYTLHEALGSGQYGKVYKALNVRTNSLVAIKAVKVEKFKEVPKLEEFTMNEIQTLARINNPYIVKFIEMLKTKNHYYFVYEYCNGGTLEDIINNQKTLPEHEALKIFKQLVAAFTSIVKNNIMHRDLKPANILLHNGQVKLADFGFCKALQSPQDLSQTMVGSPIYMAPEILTGHDYTMKADIWSLGCVLYEMLYGECPYEESTIAKLISAVEGRDIQYPSKYNVSQKTITLLKDILIKDATKRIDWDELFKRELTKTDLQDIQVYQILEQKDPSNKTQSSAELEKQKASKSFKYILNERNKIFFLYKVLEEMLELNFDQETPIYCFLMVKQVYAEALFIKKNLVDTFNIPAFQHLKNKFEYWNSIPQTFEYKSFCKLMDKEVDNSKKLALTFKEEAYKFFKNSIYQNDYEVQKEIDNTYEGNNHTFRRLMLRYIEDIKSKHFNKFLDPTSDDSTKWLVHIHKTLDALLLDEFFENFIQIDITDFEQQPYFKTFHTYQKSDLLTVVSNKINYTRNKLGF
ncbi:Serine/Threonine kinase domain protein (macronuclear) [Tetrahymena thermophila SB210]|uniref:Serine/Threonine kinase domain protein n=1 Tax=Tetrahymena thermophila (strain SB210) TaxID=312017 RepID=I7MHQ1_TETTS|nr:Serine/Threonine kinase domain protein [Tetrahymena thermophila SB210]EAS03183.1 Serine/Threonine kinase domain protein [Tetrahymena thermophila SB210]|eukprot:XP_001023428.1 Serine/Threonine kinase domain protein [Tetrahymena thermophila SB210]